jgi:hypothetical protein
VRYTGEGHPGMNPLEAKIEKGVQAVLVILLLLLLFLG